MSLREDKLQNTKITKKIIQTHSLRNGGTVQPRIQNYPRSYFVFRHFVVHDVEAFLLEGEASL